ncbi:MAG: response regulator [Deltaproteobacteria bacterium]|jgi:signal transduction histidine kinase/DNA-binding response OmpR family regulator|nr:response regulator [Deltaproteobacteria bacterium]
MTPAVLLTPLLLLGCEQAAARQQGELSPVLFLIVAAVLPACVLILLFLLHRARQAGRKFEALAQKNAAELEMRGEEMVKLRRDLESAVEDAKIANHAKSFFLTNMSHEMRTPLNAIMGIAEIHLQEEQLEPIIRDAFGRIRSSSDLLLGIVNDMLDMSKIEAGRLELMPSEYDVARLLADVTQLNLIRKEGKPIAFELQVEEGMPAMVAGDVLRVKQILNNILSNAFKYTGKGAISLSVSCDTGDEESCVTLVFRVSDTGQGMAAEQVSRLFGEYARYNLETNRTIDGTGLGMSITRNLVHMMNGELSVESEPGRGSIFTVRLPQGNVGAGVLSRETVENLRRLRISTPVQMKKSPIVREQMPYGRVLVVDDVETNLYVATGLLMPYGLTIDTAESGPAAIEKIRQGETYDIVFMDHMMPEMDGVEALRALRDLGYTRPVVALTANAMIGHAEMFRENGFDEFIAKPIDLHQLNAVLNRFVHDRQTPEVLETVRRQSPAAHGDVAGGASSQVSVNLQLAEFFVRDAEKAIAALEALCVYQYRRETDINMYAIIVHGMKSALANIGEQDLSAFASRLELAGRARDTAAMLSETPAFLSALRVAAEKIAPQEDDVGREMTDDDRAFLREKLLELKAACAAYDKKTAKKTLAEIQLTPWPRAVKDLMKTIALLLLHSNFAKVTNVVDETVAGL